MHFPDFSDIYNEDFSFQCLTEENNKKNKKTDKNKDLSSPFMSEKFSNALAFGSGIGNKLSAPAIVNTTIEHKENDTNSDTGLLKISSNISSPNKEIVEIRGSKKKCDNTTNEEFCDTLKPVNLKPVNSRNNLKNVAIEHEPEFWDFLKSHGCSFGDDKCEFRSLSYVESKECRNLSLVTPSSGYESGELCIAEKIDTPLCTGILTTSAMHANPPSNTNLSLVTPSSDYESASSCIAEEIYTPVCPDIVRTSAMHAIPPSNANLAYGLSKKSFNISNHDVTGIAASENSSNKTSKESINEFEDFLKQHCHRRTSPKSCTNIVEKKGEDELWNILNPDNLLSHYSNENNAKEDKEDEFWDFLEPNSSANEDNKFVIGSRSSAELEELRRLLSTASSPVSLVKNKEFHSSGVSSTYISASQANPQSHLNFSEEEIFKDLDLFLAEINAFTEQTQKETEHRAQFGDSSEVFNNNIQNIKIISDQKSNSSELAVIKTADKNRSYDAKIINQNIPVAIFPPLIPPRTISQSKALGKTQLQSFPRNTEQFFDTARHIFKQNNISCTKHAINIPYISDNNPYTKIDNNLLKSNTIKVRDSNSNIELHPLGKIGSTVLKTDSQISLTNVPNSLNIRLKYEKGNGTAAQLPVISSVFSIPSNIFEGSDFKFNERNTAESKEFSVSTSTKNFVTESLNENSDISQKKDIHNKDSESNTVNLMETTASGYVSPQKQKKFKRLLPRSSPKNSLFRITDSTSSNVQYELEDPTLKKALNNKKIKTNDSASRDNSISTEISASGTRTHLPQITSKILAVNSTNSTTVTNSTPVYWIVSQNPQSIPNKNSDLLMVLNTDNQIVNNRSLKMPVNFINVPFSTTATIPGVINAQVTKESNLSTNTVFQQIPFHTVSVINAESTPSLPEPSNYIKPNILSNSNIQSVSCNELKSQFPVSSETNKIHLISTSMPKNFIQTDNTSIYKIPTTASNNTNLPISQVNAPITSVSIKNISIHDINSAVNRQSKHCALSTLQPKPVTQLPGRLFPIQNINPTPRPRFRPIKSIPLGKDKNAIQQIRIPVKIADIKNSLKANIYENTAGSANILNSQNLKTSSTFKTSINLAKPTQSIANSGVQLQAKVYDFIPYKPKKDSVLEKTISANENEIVSDNKLYDMPTSSTINSSGKPNNVVEIKNLYQDKGLVRSNSVRVSVLGTDNANSSGNKLLINKLTTTNNELASKSLTDKSQKRTLAAFKELFPPPISMIPVCVMQTVQTSNKPIVSKVVVLQNTNASNNEANFSKIKNQQKLTHNKTNVKAKKIGRKTVRELLQERDQHPFHPKSQSQVCAKVLKPIFKLGSNGLLLPPDLPNSKFSAINSSQTNTGMKNNIASNSNKRPNIMILPSAAKTAQNTISSRNNSATDFHQDFQATGISETAKSNNSDIFKMPSDFLFDKMATAKEYRPRYYDMNELRIGYFKVEDDVDSCGRFRSKFKVLFKKSMFVYDFPIMKCNQIDLSNDYSYEEIVRIQVPFKTVLSMNMMNKHILMQVNKCPQVFLKNTEEGSFLISDLKKKNKMTEGILDSLQNSSVHKITLRKRQADNLKVNLCEFDSRFLTLCSVRPNSTNTVLNASPFEEDIANTHLKKISQKNRRNVIRRLPQWDSDSVLEPLELLNSDHLVSSNHVCSCRISCRSMRCSCVKAAKSCGTDGAVCLCTSCDNPLNILQSFGINLEFSLSDSCLFQNIYQIPKLHNFLQRNVKLSCCNTIACVLDCIPGTSLCPNSECNARLEFSWCGAIICYPERNPRNHCSFCGQCCFSNGRHCPICNRCYVITPKCPVCPHCRGSGFTVNTETQKFELMDNDFNTSSVFESSSVKNLSKPEIILLDGPTSENSVTREVQFEVKEEYDSAKRESKERLCLNEAKIDDEHHETLRNASADSKTEIRNEITVYESENRTVVNKDNTNEKSSGECSSMSN